MFKFLTLFLFSTLIFCQEKIDLSIKNTGANMTVAILEVDEKMIEKGDTLAVFYDLPNNEKKCGGFVIWNDNRVALTVWGNDSTSEIKDGFNNKEDYLHIYQIKDGLIKKNLRSKFLTGNNFFSNNGVSVIEKLF